MDSSGPLRSKEPSFGSVKALADSTKKHLGKKEVTSMEKRHHTRQQQPQTESYFGEDQSLDLSKGRAELI